MTRVAIMPVVDKHGIAAFRAVAGTLQSVGRTVGEAIDSITSKLPEDATGTMTSSKANNQIIFSPHLNKTVYPASCRSGAWREILAELFQR